MYSSSTELPCPGRDEFSNFSRKQKGRGQFGLSPSFYQIQLVVLELEFKRPLEVPLRISATVGSIRDNPRVRVRARRITDEGIRLVQIDMVEQVHHLNAEFKFFAFGESELLKQ
jgi:hypothetical protein